MKRNCTRRFLTIMGALALAGLAFAPASSFANGETLTIESALQRLAANGPDWRIRMIELRTADTAYALNQSQYAPTLGLSYSGEVRRDPPNPNTIFSGDRSYTDVYSASLSRRFSTGTYFEVAASDTRIDNNAGETAEAANNELLASLAQPPLHTAAVAFTLRQELLRNAFGYSERRLDEIARNQSRSAVYAAELALSELTATTLTDFWNYALAEDNLAAAESLLQNAESLRRLTVQKTALGLADPWELHQWTALAEQSRARVNSQKAEHSAARSALLARLDLPADHAFKIDAGLTDAPLRVVPLDEDLTRAYERRADLKTARLALENARLQAEIAENDLWPSLTASGTYSTRDQDRHAREAFSSELGRGRYAESRVELALTAPLWDEGRNVAARNARLDIERLEIQEQALRRGIEDELRLARQRIELGYDSLERTRSALRQTERFYGAVLDRYRRGRYDAVSLKNALDSVASARNEFFQAKVNYNISLVRYDIARNALLERYGLTEAAAAAP